MNSVSTKKSSRTSLSKKKSTSNTTGGKKTTSKKKSTSNTTGGKKTTSKTTNKTTTQKKSTSNATGGKKIISKNNLKKINKKDKTGGQFEILLGLGRIRGQKYEHWLEQRLVLHFKDTQFVNEVRKIFGYNKTSIGPSKFSKEAFCDRDDANRKLIAPKVKC